MQTATKTAVGRASPSPPLSFPAPAALQIPFSSLIPQAAPIVFALKSIAVMKDNAYGDSKALSKTTLV